MYDIPAHMYVSVTSETGSNRHGGQTAALFEDAVVCTQQCGSAGGACKTRALSLHTSLAGGLGSLNNFGIT